MHVGGIAVDGGAKNRQRQFDRGLIGIIVDRREQIDGMQLGRGVALATGKQPQQAGVDIIGWQHGDAQLAATGKTELTELIRAQTRIGKRHANGRLVEPQGHEIHLPAQALGQAAACGGLEAFQVAGLGAKQFGNAGGEFPGAYLENAGHLSPGLTGSRRDTGTRGQHDLGMTPAGSGDQRVGCFSHVRGSFS